MKSPRLIVIPVLGLLTGLLLAAPSKPSAGDSVAIRQRIDALLKRRLKPEALPVDPPNPFALTAASSGLAVPTREAAVPVQAPTTVTVPGEEEGSASTTELLARLAARLRITGIIRIKEQLHIIINDNPWKEGDYMSITQGSRIVRLQVARIQPGQLTLRLEDAELMLRF